jgi:hypothetical protein
MGWVSLRPSYGENMLTIASLAMYLEYGIRFPLTGGELHYVRSIRVLQNVF